MDSEIISHDQCVRDVFYNLHNFAGEPKYKDGEGFVLTVTEVTNDGVQRDLRVCMYRGNARFYVLLENCDEKGYVNVEVPTVVWDEVYSTNGTISDSSFERRSGKSDNSEGVDAKHADMVSCSKNILDRRGFRVTAISLTSIDCNAQLKDSFTHMYAMWYSDGSETCEMVGDLEVPIFMPQRNTASREVGDCIDFLGESFIVPGQVSKWKGRKDDEEEGEEKKKD